MLVARFAARSAAMNRVGEYIRFAAWFSGLGYMALWPMTAQDDGSAVMSIACGQSVALLDFICAPRAGLHLSPGLHLAGMMSSGFVLMCLALRPLRWRQRWRARAGSEGAQTLEAIVRLRIGRKSAPPPPHRYVRPRSHFGLRNAPQ
jgi:hypothetical protein